MGIKKIETQKIRFKKHLIVIDYMADMSQVVTITGPNFQMNQVYDEPVPSLVEMHLKRFILEAIQEQGE